MKKFLALVLAVFTMATPVMAEGITVYSNCNQVEDKGVIIDGRTMVPVRGIFEYMGYQVEWDNALKTAILKNDENSIILTNGATSFYVNGKAITPDVPQQIVNDRFMLPLRAVGEALNAQVDWDNVNKIAYVTQKEYLNELQNLMGKDVTVEETTEATTQEINEQSDMQKTDIDGITIEVVDPDQSFDNITEITIE